jgi:hypothetical protein
MKKFIALLAIVGSAFVASANSVTHVSESFINTGTYLCVSNGVPFNYTTASNVWFYSYPVGTNVLALGGTNANGILYPQAVVDAPVFPDINADVNPNIAITVVEGANTNLPIQYPQTSAIGNLAVSTATAYAPFSGTQVVTNTTTYTFATISEGGFGFADTAGGKTFSFSVSQTNNTLAVISTNVPTSFLQGARAIRLVSVSNTSTGTGPGVVVDAVKLTGWTP